MYINFKTGEVLDFQQMTDEQIVEQLADLEEVYEVARTARMQRGIPSSVGWRPKGQRSSLHP